MIIRAVIFLSRQPEYSHLFLLTWCIILAVFHLHEYRLSVASLYLRYQI